MLVLRYGLDLSLRLQTDSDGLQFETKSRLLYGDAQGRSSVAQHCYSNLIKLELSGPTKFNTISFTKFIFRIKHNKHLRFLFIQLILECRKKS